MPIAERKITNADIVPDREFAASRAERRQALAPIRKLRRIGVGPYCTCYFESFDTMLFQVQEMLLVEKGGDEQLKDELLAYNPLIPQGGELVATVMFEIDNPIQRQSTLSRLGGIENRFILDIGGSKTYGTPEQDTERTDEHGKTSAVHFIRFAVPLQLQKSFADPETTIMLGVNDDRYPHFAVIPIQSRNELAKDL